jgi:hypothetical protein
MQRESKEVVTEKIMDILSNPDQSPPIRTALCKVLGKEKGNFYKMFPAAELDQLYKDALLIRRERMAAQSGIVDAALLKAVKAGDVQAIKLYYQRHEGWAPTTKISGDITHMTWAERCIQMDKEEAAKIEHTPESVPIST